GADVGPVSARAVIAALDVVSGVRPVFRGEPYDHRAAGIDRRGPPARPDQLITCADEGWGGAGGGERLTCEVVELHQRRPGRGIILADSLPAHRVPDNRPAR